MHVSETTDPARVVSLMPAEISALNPNTGTMPIFMSRRDADITLACYRRHPVLIRDGAANGNPWGLHFTRLFDMANDSDAFRTATDLEKRGASFRGWLWSDGASRWLPVYEAKMLHLWQHRHGTYHGYDVRDGTGVRAIPTPSSSQLDDPNFEPIARYWVDERVVRDAVPATWDREWLLGWRDIATSLDVRSFIPSVLPLSAVGDGFLLAFPIEPRNAALLHGIWSTFIFDFLARQKLSGTHMKYFVMKQLTCPTPAAFSDETSWSGSTYDKFLRPRVLELAYTSYRTGPYAVDVVGRDPGVPFRWVPERRDQLKAELDAAAFHLYGLGREDVEHVLDAFPIVRRYEERDLGEFRTKRLVLAAYDAMTQAAQTGVPFVSPLDPPPGHGPRHKEQAS